MPIEVHAQLRRVSQEEFARVAYDAMGVFFAVHNTMGRLFEERIYKDEFARRHGEVQCEVPVDVSFEGFGKRYWLDMLICGCAVFEVKTATCLTPDHRAQLINYLLLTELSRGKLVNVRPEAIEHEFVNALASHQERRQFDVDDRCWRPIANVDKFWKEWLIEAIREWGSGLALSLYQEAVISVLGGWARVERNIEVLGDDGVIGLQKVPLTGPATMLKITAFRRELGLLQEHLNRFLQHTRLEAIQWVNITQRHLTFRTLDRDTSF